MNIRQRSILPSGTLVVVAVLALLACGCAGGGGLDAKALSQESSSLQSLAAEGALLARDSAAGKTTRIFTRVHSNDLYKAASQSAKSLRTAKTRQALEPKLRRLASAARRVSADLERLGQAAKDEQRRLARELEAIAKELS
jgi:hypothetical protein